MTLAWSLFYGCAMGMSERDVLAQPVGQFNDLVACYLIHHDMAKPDDTPDGGEWDDEEAIPDWD